MQYLEMTTIVRVEGSGKYLFVVIIYNPVIDKIWHNGLAPFWRGPIITSTQQVNITATQSNTTDKEGDRWVLGDI